MPLGKVKRTKQIRRLQDRIAAWERTIAALTASDNKDGWKKPGSNRK